MKLLIINGPNLNLLGVREKSVYGTMSYIDLCEYILAEAKKLNVEIEIVQSNSEGEIINFLHNAIGKFQGVIINPGAYTHYSYAIHDAIKAISIKTVEVHLSNIHAREEFRSKSVTAPACVGQISGFGHYGYIMAIMAIMAQLNNSE
ncbi:MAG: type II 3-dehydroquinate dehydratase [Clostridiaceae bacterium]|nr:type II 3-dehydroquinate dehydratase [Clostridiaceae bacterium]